MFYIKAMPRPVRIIEKVRWDRVAPTSMVFAFWLIGLKLIYNHL
jgi:hypothetical protein